MDDTGIISSDKEHYYKPKYHPFSMKCDEISKREFKNIVKD